MLSTQRKIRQTLMVVQEEAVLTAVPGKSSEILLKLFFSSVLQQQLEVLPTDQNVSLNILSNQLCVCVCECAR